MFSVDVLSLLACTSKVAAERRAHGCRHRRPGWQAAAPEQRRHPGALAGSSGQEHTRFLEECEFVSQIRKAYVGGAV